MPQFAQPWMEGFNIYSNSIKKSRRQQGTPNFSVEFFFHTITHVSVHSDSEKLGNGLPAFIEF